jgi:hypothetical protein
LILGAQLIGCADSARWLRRYTYPPDFRYIEREQLRSAMWQLARHMRELDQDIHSPLPPEQHRKDIVEHLDDMEAAARSLDTAAIESPADRYEHAEILTRHSASAGCRGTGSAKLAIACSLTGACVYCHGGR